MAHYFPQAFSSEKKGLQVLKRLTKFRVSMPFGGLSFFPSFAVMKDEHSDWRLCSDIDEAKNEDEYSDLRLYWGGIIDFICVDMGIVS